MTETERLLGAILEELREIRAALSDRSAPAAGDSVARESPAEVPADPSDGLADTPTETPDVGAAESPLESAAVAWLQARKILLRRLPAPASADAVFDRLASTLGSRYQHLWRLHDQLRRCLATGQSLSLQLTDRSQEEVAACTALAHDLSKLAILTRYHYQKSTRLLNATVERSGAVVAFFTGGWFERYVCLQAEQVLAASGHPTAHLQNPQVQFANGDAGELDLFFMVAGTPLWIECKTGDYQLHVRRYGELRRRLELPASRALLVLLGQTANLCQELSAIYGLTVCNEQTLTAALQVAVGLTPPAPAPSSAPAPPTVTHTASGRAAEVTAWLTRCGLRPLPAERPALIAALLAVVAEQPPPLVLRDLKQRLVERTTTSGSQVQDVLQAVLRGGGLLGADGVPLASFLQPCARLLDHRSEVLEACCCRAYRAALEHPEAPPGLWPVTPAEFSAATGGALPGQTA
ncbi:MAG: hypothetical protein IT204_14820 [Fimbriimonadaceae bacterium]|nr:hypothetical protein [Fimbriimonadaceae bacterium]